MSDLISRQAAIDALNVSAELLRRVLEDTDIVGVERAEYKWGLGLIESNISDIKELPSAQPEIVRCKECKWYDKSVDLCHNPRYGDGWANYPPPAVNEDYFCKDGERSDGGTEA